MACGEKKMGSLELAFFIELKVNPELRHLWNSMVGNKLNPEEPWTIVHAERFQRGLRSLEYRYTQTGYWTHPIIDKAIENKNLTEKYTFEKEGALLHWYLNVNHFTVLALDDLAGYGTPVNLPREIFKLSTVECLSLRNNCLRSLPADVGRLRSLKKLVLTGNKLCSDIPALPFTLTFCSQLETLHLDSNSLEAVPGIVTQLPSLATLYRHDNENYFRTTFMWYGLEKKERVHPARMHPPWRLPVGIEAPQLHLDLPAEYETEGGGLPAPVAGGAGGGAATAEWHPRLRQPAQLRYLAARAMVQSKLNFFELPALSPAAQDYVASVYHTFHVCENCNTALTRLCQGYYTFAFRSLFLGNTCVPFQHWSCSEPCARAIERSTRANEMRDPDVHYRYYDSPGEATEAALTQQQQQQQQRPSQRPLAGLMNGLSLSRREAVRYHKCSIL